ncbi:MULTISPECIES: SIR2 family protein [unclassified Methanoculleus]|uniref:SIR2 family protein n=3 Tax=Methanoculleus TaxID=45989 RepID=A0ABD8A8K7_9EURY|nr:SIR2 family protein [Methanoculleus palmolei]
MNADRVVPVAYAMHASPKRYALLIGAGISVAAGLPTASDVSGNMILAVARGRGEKVERGEKNEVCLAWFEETFGEPATFQRLMKELGISEGNRKDGLKKFISRTDENGDPIPGAPTAAHRAVVRLVKSGTVSLVITTNFDTLMEEALKAEFVPYEVITEESDVRQMSVFPDRCRVLKVNGDFERGTLRITPEDLKHYPPAMEDYLKRIFGEYGLVVCGWSGEFDTHLIQILCAEEILRRYPVFWCRRNGGSVPREVCRALMPNGIVIDDADDFFTVLETVVERFSRFEPRTTLTAAAAVRKVKDALRQTKPELVLPDLINEETDRVLAFLADESRYQADVIDSKGFYTATLTGIEGAAAPLAAMVATVAQYDDGSFADLVSNTIERLINVSPVTPEISEIQNKGQKTVSDYIERLLRLRYYPALLVIYASGIAAVHTRHFNTLEAIVRKPMISRYNVLLREKVPYYEYVNVWDVIGLCHEWTVDLAHKRFGEETRYRDYPYLAIHEFVKILIPNQYAFFEALDIFEYIFGLAYLAGIKGDLDEGTLLHSSVPGPLRSRNVYLCRRYAGLDSTQPFLSLPAHVVNYLADFRKRTQESRFFGGLFGTFEEANRKYAKGFGIEAPDVGAYRVMVRTIRGPDP